MTPLYESLRRDSARYLERGDCLAIAVAVVAGVPYDRAHNGLNLSGVRTWRRFKTRDWQEGTWRTLAALGYSVEQVKPCPALSVAAFERLQLAGRFLLYRSTDPHIVGVLDGKAHDWTSGTSERIEEAYRVSPIPKHVRVVRIHPGAVYL